ncbi:MAG: UDP-N-acetylglucosamine 2-epimerase [Alphaproteobacteria bacterium]
MPTVDFVTLSRSDYTSLRPVALAAQQDPNIETRVIVGGSHLLKRYGHSIDQIKEDGVHVHDVADFLTEEDDSPEELAAAYAKAAAECVRIFSKDRPDYIFLIGDRWEMLAVATAASLLHIPIVHHSGGDITQGSSDNQTRYAISCLAHLHLVALDQHRKRLVHMGEESWRVMTVGEPALSHLLQYEGSDVDIYSKLNLAPGTPFVLSTFHPTSFDPLPAERQIDVFLSVLKGIKEHLIITAPNPDSGSDLFLKKLRTFADSSEHVQLFDSLGAKNYYAAMAHAKYMIGNSSSGLWEAPSFKLPVINVGPRQQGRAHGDNVENVSLDDIEIKAAIHKVTRPDFKASLSGHNPYVQPNTVEDILNVLKKSYDKSELLAKRFVDPLAPPVLSPLRGEG